MLRHKKSFIFEVTIPKILCIICMVIIVAVALLGNTDLSALDTAFFIGGSVFCFGLLMKIIDEN